MTFTINDIIDDIDLDILVIKKALKSMWVAQQRGKVYTVQGPDGAVLTKDEVIAKLDELIAEREKWIAKIELN